jgi:DNA polymerase
MFIGEAPGQEEDFHGTPLIGEEGNLLTEMLRAMQLTREEVFITNILKCRLPDNRNPHVDEIHACRSYLHRQIALINPKIIIAFGQVSAQTLLATTDTIESLRGKIHPFQHKPLITVYHPNYMLRSPIEKSKAWQDLQFALEAFKQHE